MSHVLAHCTFPSGGPPAGTAVRARWGTGRNRCHNLVLTRRCPPSVEGMSQSKRIRQIAAASALVLGGSVVTAAPAQASTDGACYSFNKDSSACGWDGPPAPSTGTCSGGVALAVGGAVFPPSWAGLAWGVASGSYTLATSCGNVFR